MTRLNRKRERTTRTHSAMQLYFSGESLRNTAKSLKLIGVEASHKTVYCWIRKYVGLMEDYLAQIKPQVSDMWGPMRCS